MSWKIMDDGASEYSQPWTAILETNNSLDVTPDDLEDLAEILEATASESSIEIGYQDQYGSGVTGHEVLLFWIPNAESVRDNVYAALIVATIPWLRTRFKRKHGAHRPKTFTIYDASTGKPVRTLTLRDAESEPEEGELDLLMRRPIPPRRQRGRHRRGKF
jgi:hypothetical protein